MSRFGRKGVGLVLMLGVVGLAWLGMQMRTQRVDHSFQITFSDTSMDIQNETGSELRTVKAYLGSSTSPVRATKKYEWVADGNAFTAVQVEASEPLNLRPREIARYPVSPDEARAGLVITYFQEGVFRQKALFD